MRAATCGTRQRGRLAISQRAGSGYSLKPTSLAQATRSVAAMMISSQATVMDCYRVEYQIWIMAAGKHFGLRKCERDAQQRMPHSGKVAGPLVGRSRHCLSCWPAGDLASSVSIRPAAISSPLHSQVWNLGSAFPRSDSLPTRLDRAGGDRILHLYRVYTWVSLGRMCNCPRRSRCRRAGRPGQ